MPQILSTGRVWIAPSSRYNAWNPEDEHLKDFSQERQATTPRVVSGESTRPSMISLPIRPARFDLNVALTFENEDGVVEGRCINVSASGMLAVFARELELFTVGEVYLEAGGYFANISARVARLQNGDHGLSFQIDSDSDRSTIQLLVDYAAAMHQPLHNTSDIVSPLDAIKPPR